MTNFVVDELVWVKLGRLFWPAVVRDKNDCSEFIDALKNEPAFVAEFFDRKLKDVYKDGDILRYNCQQKEAIILKGMQLMRQQPSVALTFKRHVITAERLIGGDANVLSKVKMEELRRLSDSGSSFGEWGRPARASASDTTAPEWLLGVTHPRFIAGSDYQSRELVQVRSAGARSADCRSALDSSGYSCQQCSFRCRRVNVIMLHLRWHRLHEQAAADKRQRKRNTCDGRRRPAKKRKVDNTRATQPNVGEPKGAVSAARGSTKQQASGSAQLLMDWEDEEDEDIDERQRIQNDIDRLVGGSCKMNDGDAQTEERSVSSPERRLSLDWSVNGDNVAAVDDMISSDDEYERSPTSRRSPAMDPEAAFARLTSSDGQTGLIPTNHGQNRLNGFKSRSSSGSSSCSNSPRNSIHEHQHDDAALSSAVDELITNLDADQSSDVRLPIVDTINSRPPITDAADSSPSVTERVDSPLSITEPSGSVQSVSVPSGSVPSVSEPSGSVPSVSEPYGPVPSVAEPSGSVPSVSEPSGSVPSVAEPSGSVQSVSEPFGSVPPVSEPSGSAPSVSESSGSVPSVAEPSGSVPSVSEPPGSMPLVAEPPVKEPMDSVSSDNEPTLCVMEPSNSSVNEPSDVVPTVMETTKSPLSVTEPAYSAESVTVPSVKQPTDSEPSVKEATESVPSVSETTKSALSVTEPTDSVPTVSETTKPADSVPDSETTKPALTVTGPVDSVPVSETIESPSVTEPTGTEPSVKKPADTEPSATSCVDGSSSARDDTYSPVSVERECVGEAESDELSVTESSGPVAQLPAGLQVLSVEADGSSVYVLVSVQDGCVRPLSPHHSALSSLQPDTLLAYEVAQSDGTCRTAYLTPSQLVSPSHHPHILSLLAGADTGHKPGAVDDSESTT